MIRLGVIGYGCRIRDVMEPIRFLRPDIKVTGVVDPDRASVRGLMAQSDRDDVVFYDSVDELVRRGKIDGLMIGTRCNLHTPYAVQAARYDVPLFLEKPVAISMKQAIALERAFSRTRCKAVVSFPLRVTKLCERTRAQIARGAAGEPLHISAVNYVPYGFIYFDQAYRWYKVTQGLFLQKATHDLDYMMYLMDSPVTRVGAMTIKGRVYGGRKKAGLRCSGCGERATCLEGPVKRRRALGKGADNDHWCLYSVDCGSPAAGMNEDCSSAVVEFESGAQGTYSQVFFVRRDAGSRGAIVSGKMGTVSFNWWTSQIKCVRHFQRITRTLEVKETGGHSGGDLQLARYFIGLIEGTIRKSRTPIETGLRSVYTCLAAKESSETGKFVKVRQCGL